MPALSRRTVLAAFGAAAVPPLVVTGARPALAADEFGSNTELYANANYTEGVDYARRFRRHGALDDNEAPGDTFPDTAIIALHGGGIEPGTSELCLAVAGYHPAGGLVGGAVYDYWLFEGIRSSDNAILHITSTNCDDPVARATVGGSQRAVSLHGCSPEQAEYPAGTAAIVIGGRDTPLKAAMLSSMRTTFNGTDIQVKDAALVPRLGGDDPDNIVNLTVPKRGVQFELTTPLRARMFGTNTRTGRKNTTLPLFWSFTNAVRETLASS
ncbi:poly-gamma-glutamate hydrolase family protein [Actinoplanes bogorensis]|uniref:Poly-gamma-glutamate hydrolase family protein n=1 Tax=Paractinoplanes bogorensis TaxID=1610840 RepID=A0ABS5Z417_9ACTN|nr:poly-gamma-glutamate hydrolase family protein [Actinoplanes bogorensis]MBU2670408.1 poly-gamma-glutamate hydrolase family protein [Actinoplanes bogorensis]